MGPRVFIPCTAHIKIRTMIKIHLPLVQLSTEHRRNTKVEVSGMTTLSPWRQSDVSPAVGALEGASSSGVGGQGGPAGGGGGGGGGRERHNLLSSN